MARPDAIVHVGHGDLPQALLDAAPVYTQVNNNQAEALIGPVNAILRLHAPIVEFADADNIHGNPGTCGHCGEPTATGHYLDPWYSNLLCPKNPKLWCEHCPDGQGGYADWPCATVKALAPATD